MPEQVQLDPEAEHKPEDAVQLRNENGNVYVTLVMSFVKFRALQLAPELQLTSELNTIGASSGRKPAVTLSLQL